MTLTHDFRGQRDACPGVHDPYAKQLQSRTINSDVVLLFVFNGVTRMIRRPRRRPRIGYVLWRTGRLILNLGLSLAAVRLLGRKVEQFEAKPLSNLHTPAQLPAISTEAACDQAASPRNSN